MVANFGISSFVDCLESLVFDSSLPTDVYWVLYRMEGEKRASEFRVQMNYRWFGPLRIQPVMGSDPHLRPSLLFQ